MKKLLIVANVSKAHIRKFHIPFILHMKQRGWRVDVACRLDVPIPECDNAYDLPCDRNPFAGGITKSVKVLQDILKKNRYDVVLCNTITGSIIARLAAKPFRKDGLKIWYINHGMHFFQGAPAARWILGYPLEKALAPVTDMFITINSADYRMAKKHLKAKAFERIHGIGVNLQQFRSCRLSEQEKLDIRQSLGISPEDYIMTYVAEISENKNQLMLLKMFPIVNRSIPNLKMLLVGPALDDGKAQSIASQSGLGDKVLFLGWRADIAQLLNISDVYVASSKSEGLGLNLIEAMACNVPVVAARNRGHEEIVRHGENGYLVEENDYEAMAAHVLQLEGDSGLAEKLTRQAQTDIEKYELENVLKELSSLFDLYA